MFAEALVAGGECGQRLDSAGRRPARCLSDRESAVGLGDLPNKNGPICLRSLGRLWGKTRLSPIEFLRWYKGRRLARWIFTRSCGKGVRFVEFNEPFIIRRIIRGAL
jgi:hypothetical protein